MADALDLREGGNRMVLQPRDSAKLKWMQRIGWGITALMIAFLLFDSIGKLVLEHHVVEATTMIGYPLEVIRPLGLICLACTQGSGAIA